MSWEAEIGELRRGVAMAREMGGAEKVKRHHDNGKLTVRERIDRLLDPGSFHEVGAIAGRASYADDGRLTAFQPSNFVCGRGRIVGRPGVVGGDDFTARGGAADGSVWEEQGISEQMAYELRMPVVRLVDGTGGGGSVKRLEMDGRTYVPANPAWDWVVRNLGAVPTVALALGSVAGLGAARVATSHYALMVKGLSQMFVAGPPALLSGAGSRNLMLTLCYVRRLLQQSMAMISKVNPEQLRDPCLAEVRPDPGTDVEPERGPPWTASKSLSCGQSKSATCGSCGCGSPTSWGH